MSIRSSQLRKLYGKPPQKAGKYSFYRAEEAKRGAIRRRDDPMKHAFAKRVWRELNMEAGNHEREAANERLNPESE